MKGGDTVTERKVSTQIPVIFQNVEKYEKEDTRFLKVKIWLMHTGINHNGSSFSKEVVDKAIPTLANTPILAFIEEGSTGDRDFSDHRIVLHRNEDGEFNFKYLGSAVGVIPEANNAHWETRVTDSGEVKEYLVVDALMWTKWGDPTDIMNRKGITSQSMELADSYSGSFDDKGVFHFETFSFFGACLLGDDVTPAMESSTVEVQFSQSKDMQNTIENKLKEFYTLFSQEGGTEMEDNLTTVEETEAIENVVESNFEENKENESVENNAPVEAENVLEKDEQLIKEDSNEAPVSSDDSTEQSEDVQTKDIIIDEDSEDALEKRETVAINENAVDMRDEDSAEESVDEAEEKEDFKSKYDDLFTKFEDIQNELNELKSYKRQREEDDIKGKFADKLSEQEFEQVFSSMKDADIQDVEDKLFALYGKKNFSITSTNSQVNKVVLASPKVEDSVQSPYGGLFDKYKK